jgi:hypothetical protein
MSSTRAGWLLIGIAVGLTIASAYPAALFVLLAAGGVALTAETDDQRDARQRNHAHRR